MAVKYQRNPVSTIGAINNELQKIQVALEDAVSRTGTAPNQLEATVDANSQRIINLPEPVTNTEPVRKADFDELGNNLRSDVYTAVRDAEDATDDAIAATNSANTAASNANSAADNANTAASNAYQAITDLESDGYAVISQIESDGQSALDALRVVNVGSFEDGATLTARNEVLYYQSEQTYYRWDGALPKTVAPASTPSSTGGVGVGAWVNVGQAELASSLADAADSANRVARMAITADSLKDLVNAPRIANRQYSVKGFYAGTDVGGGMFYWDATRDKADHNVGTVIDPDRVAAWDGTQADLATLFTAGSGTGCFVRFYENHVYMDWFGASHLTDISLFFSRAVDATPYRGVLYGPSTETVFTQPNTVNKRITVIFPNKITRSETSVAIDFGIHLAADYCVGSFNDVDINANGSTTFNGRGEAIRVSGKSCYLRDTRCGNTPFIGTGNAVEIRGADCVIENTVAYDAGYAGFRTFGIAVLNSDGVPVGDCQLINCEAKNFRVKGYVNNRHMGVVTLDRFKSSFNEVEGFSASEHILFDAGDGYISHKAILKKCNIFNGMSLSNIVKFVGVRKVDIWDSVWKNSRGGSVATVRFQPISNVPDEWKKMSVNFYDCGIESIATAFLMSADGADYLDINYRGGSLSCSGHAQYTINVRGADVILDNTEIDIASGESLIALRNYDNFPERTITIRNPIVTSYPNATVLTPNGTINAGQVVVVSNKNIPLGSTSSLTRKIARNEGLVRNFFNTSGTTDKPIGSGWRLDDHFWMRSITQDDGNKSLCLVCVKEGTVSFNAWTASTAYSEGAIVYNGDNVYVCVTSGTSDSSGGPTGTVAGITDGTVVWDYYDTRAIFVKQAIPAGIWDGSDLV